MTRIRLKELQAALTLGEKHALIHALQRWYLQQLLLEVQFGAPHSGAFDRDAWAETVRKSQALIDDSLRSRDQNGALKTGVTEVLRGLAIMQRESTGPKLNVWFRAHLPPHVFALLYEAAGLDTADLRYDTTFPTDPITL